MTPRPAPPPLPCGTLTPSQRLARLGLALAPTILLSFLIWLPHGGWLTGRFRSWVGLPCPLCGGTRALQALIHGEWLLAIYYNPLALAAAAGALVIAVWCGWEALSGRPLPRFWQGQERQLARLTIAALALHWTIHITLAVTRPKTELLDSGGIIWRIFSLPGKPNAS